MKNLKFKILILILTSIFYFLVSGMAHAQSVDLGLYPPVFQIQTTAPASVNVPFFIENFADQSVDLTISLKPFTANLMENGTISFLDNLENFPDPSLLQRIQVIDQNSPIQKLTLAPKQKKDLNLAIEIPQDQTKGDYYISVVFTSNNQTAIKNNYSQATEGIASNILLTVGPVGETKGYLENFSAPPLVDKGPVPFTVELKNTSDHYITPKGEIVITNMFGQNVGKIELLPVNILSDTVRKIPDAIQNNPDSKNYADIKAVVDKNQSPVAVWPEKFLVGPYTATLTIALSETGPLFKKSVFFFAFPSEYLVIILAVILIITFIILRVRKKLT